MTGRLLVVDDDQGVTATFARMLALEGYQVRTAQSAEDGLRQVDEAGPDAIFLDLRMPRVNGLGFIHRLRKRQMHRKTPVVIVTGDYFIDDGMALELKHLGVEIRFKPLWLDDLVDLARMMLAKNAKTSSPHVC